MAGVDARWRPRWEFVVLALIALLAIAVSAPFISLRHRSAERRERVERTMAEIRTLPEISPKFGGPAETYSEGALIKDWMAAALGLRTASLPPGQKIAVYKFEGVPGTILLVLYDSESQAILGFKVL